MKSITVFVITYNQEKVISRALDSILSQKDWGLFQIVIGDDASTDNTFDVLCEYKSKYPELLKVIRNNRNLGIFANLQNIVNNREDSDLYLFCSGDDEIGEGYFKSLQVFIKEKEIDISHAVGIFSDWAKKDPNGKEILVKQDLCKSNYDNWSLYIRGKISPRSLALTKSVIDNFMPIDLSHGLLYAESQYDSQAFNIVKETYYLPFRASVYYSGTGVSTKLNPRYSDYYTRQWKYKWNYYLNNFINNRKDYYYALYELTKADFYINPTVKRYVKMYYYYIKGMLPNCHNSVKDDFWRFGALFKYLIKYYGNPVDYMN